MSKHKPFGIKLIIFLFLLSLKVVSATANSGSAIQKPLQAEEVIEVSVSEGGYCFDVNRCDNSVPFEKVEIIKTTQVVQEFTSLKSFSNCILFSLSFKRTFCSFKSYSSVLALDMPGISPLIRRLQI